LSETLSHTGPASTGVAASVELRMQPTVVARLISLQTILGCPLDSAMLLGKAPLPHPPSFAVQIFGQLRTSAAPANSRIGGTTAFRWP